MTEAIGLSSELWGCGEIGKPWVLPKHCGEVFQGLMKVMSMSFHDGVR